MFPVPDSYRLALLGAAALAGFAVGGVGAWKLRGLMADTDLARAQNAHLQTIASARSEAEAMRRRNEEMKAQQEARIYELSQQYENERSKKDAEINRLNADLLARPVRVRVANCSNSAGSSGMPEAAGNPGGPAGETTAELERSLVGNLAGIAGDGDRAIIQLNALIDACSAIIKK